MAVAQFAEPKHRRDPVAIDKTIRELTAAFGNRVVTSQAVREQHGNTLTWIENQPPDAVVFPQSTEEVQQIVRICGLHGTPVIPFGIGSSLEGHVNAPYGGVSIDFHDMNKMLAVHAEDLDCVVEPGITRKQLNEYLRDRGLFFPIDPGADASLGGMAATRASGTNAVRYGTMKDNVLAMQVVMANGEVMTTSRRAKKTSAGYDLTRLMVGSEGTLGVITELTLKLSGIPEAISAGVCPFPSVDAACQATILTIQSGIPVARIELLDALQVRASNRLFQAVPVGSADAVRRVSRQRCRRCRTVRALRRNRRRTRRRTIRLGDQGRRTATGSGRRGTTVYWAARHLRPGAAAFATDVCVPISRLAECVNARAERDRRARLVAPIVGHVGDGNFHLSLLVDMSDADEVKRAKILLERLVELALVHGRHLHRRARRRPGQDEIPARGTWRAGARRHGGDQAGARSAKHHESGQDRRANVITDLPPRTGKKAYISHDEASPPGDAARRRSCSCKQPCSDWRSRSSWRWWRRWSVRC